MQLLENEDMWKSRWCGAKWGKARPDTISMVDGTFFDYPNICTPQHGSHQQQVPMKHLKGGKDLQGIKSFILFNF
jgi:hypothetical protein